MRSSNSSKKHKVDLTNLRGLNVTIMGLGLHGGGVESAKFCASQGANLLVTDLRSKEILKPSIDQLDDFDITYVLGEHREEDFRNADLVIKNPGVKPNNPFLQLASQISTDIALFLSHYSGPILGITGTKGKSSTASALAFGLKQQFPGTKLGGNITVSPLSFLNEILSSPRTPVVLELSSFQLGDLRYSSAPLPLMFSGITNIESDHQDYYGSMESYVQDKEVIFLNQQPGSWVCLNGNQTSWTKRFLSHLPNHVTPWCVFSSEPKTHHLLALGISDPENMGLAWIDESMGYLKHPGMPLTSMVPIIPAQIKVPGDHQKMNLLVAGIGMTRMGMMPDDIVNALGQFPGIPHRLEYLGTIDHVEYYNDSAATIPEAVVMGVQSFKDKPVHLICGGTNKGLDFSPLSTISSKIASVHLLDGTATAGILQALLPGQIRTGLFGPFPSLEQVVQSAKKIAKPGEVILFSPGCASFGLFLNEFDRGNRFRNLFGSLQKEGQL
jgi:UDP-N-acetylmuramoylalanine--D-glutamate ligase